MAPIVEISEAQTRLSALIERARLGEEIIIAEAGEPIARLVSEPSRKFRRPGSAKGQIVIHDEFYGSLPDDLLDLFEGKHDKLLGD